MDSLERRLLDSMLNTLIEYVAGGHEHLAKSQKELLLDALTPREEEEKVE